MKKLVLIVLVLLVVAGAIGWLSLRPAKPIKVYGPLSAQDVAEIRQIVKQDLVRRVFPELSWRSFRELPGNSKNYVRHEILDIRFFPAFGRAAVTVQLSAPKLGTELLPIYSMSKTPSGWKLDSICRMPANVVMKAPPARKSGEINNIPIYAITNLPYGGKPTNQSFQSLTPPAKLMLPGPLASNESLMSLTLDRPEDRRRKWPELTLGTQPPVMSPPRSNFTVQLVAPAPPVSITNFLPGH